VTPASAPLSFLVVDDSEDIRAVFVQLVERLGHVAHQAADGVEAVQLLGLERYDVMLLDLTMPRMSGEDVIRWLREHPEWGAGMKVVVVTARSGDGRVTPGVLGVDAVLPKPLRAQQLRDLLDGLWD
jgi:CheY-like chemotaxis protein